MIGRQRVNARDPRAESGSQPGAGPVPSGHFSRIVRVAARCFSVPFAGFVFENDARQWAAAHASNRFVGRALTYEQVHSFCLNQSQVKTVVCARDVKAGNRFGHTSLLQVMPDLAFFAAAPIEKAVGRGDGYLVIMDTAPRHGFSAEDCQQLSDLAGMVAGEMMPLQDDVGQRQPVGDNHDQATTTLERNQRFLEAVLESIQEGVVACDADGRLSYFNGVTQKFHGLDHSDIPPEQWADHYSLFEADGITPLDTNRIPLFRAYQGEQVLGQELVIRDRKGGRRQIVANATRMVDGEGVVLGAMASMHDITKERLAEAGWHDAEARYRAIFNNSFQLCCLVDCDGVVLEINDTAVAFLGKTRTDMVGRPLVDSLYWRQDECRPKRLLAAFRRANRGEFVRYEDDIENVSSFKRAIDLSIKPVLDEAGAISCLIVEGRDMSDLKQSQSMLELLIDNLPFHVAYIDSEFNYRFINKTGASWYAKAPRDFVDQSALSMLPEEQFEVLQQRMKAVFEGETVTAEREHMFPDGTCRRLHISFVPDDDPSGQVRGAIAIAMDITEQFEANASLVENEKRYRKLYNKTPVMLHSIDRDGVLLRVSDFWLETLGYERRAVLGSNSSWYFTEASREQLTSLTEEVNQQQGLCKSAELQMVTREGKVIDVLLSAIADYDEKGTFIKTLAVMTDITARKALERNFLQAQKMEMVGQLTGGMAHDFNNLLGVVLGNLQLIEGTVGENPKMTRRVAAAINAVDKGAELTQRLLAFSRKQKLETEQFNPNPLIAGMTDMLTRTLGEAITIHCQLGEDVVDVETDAHQLESALLNLAINARDAMPDGGALVIESSCLTIDDEFVELDSEHGVGDYVVIAVTDSGCGIASDQVEKVFEPFFTTKEVGKGSGMGLSMIYGFMKQTGGYVRIYSEVGRGTTVRLYFPAKRTSQTRSCEPVEGIASQQRGEETILVVEDQPEMREVAVSLLKDLGYSTIEAENGDAAIAIIRQRDDIDLLFTDIVMPGTLDGTELARASLAERPALRVVFTTGYAEASVLQKGDVNSATNLVTKPYRRGDLANKIRAALDMIPHAISPSEARRNVEFF